jgi:hypothetical protein
VFYFPISKLTFGIAVAYQFAGRALLALDGFKMAVEALSPEFYHGGLGLGREHKYFLRSKRNIIIFTWPARASELLSIFFSRLRD